MVEPVSTPEARSEADAAVSTRRPMAPYIALAVALVVGALFVLLAGSKTRVNREDASSPLINRPAPDVVGPTLDGGEFSLSRRKGSWVVLNFFQTTCVPCVQEHPELVAFAEQQASIAEGAELVSVIWNDSFGPVREFFAANGGGTWPVVASDGAAVDYGVPKVPETWIIDPNGVVVVHIITTVTADGLATLIDQLKTAEAQTAGG